MSAVPMPLDDQDGARELRIAREDAFADGVQAGRLMLSPSLNPYADGEIGHAEWERGRAAALLERRRIAEQLRQRAKDKAA